MTRAMICIMQSVWGLLLLCSMSLATDPIVMELEASMTSTLLSDMQASVARVSTVPDSDAVVGKIFKMRLPLVSEDCGAIDLLSGIGSAAFPDWLNWDGQLCLLQGLPLEGDKGLYRFSLSSEALQRNGSGIHSQLLLSGTKLSYSSYTNIRQPDVFFITVNPDDQQDIESAPVSLQTQSNATNVCICSSGQPETVLIIILDADLTKMNSRERLVLLQKMTLFANEPPELLRVMPVINNRFFDMTAFMAGPGNAKMVVENGALLSWKLGCALDQSKLPDISGVQVPAKDGTMSTILGYPVVGWYIVNKKPLVVKRVRRQIHNPPTPVPSHLAPTTHLVPAERIVPALASPSIAPSHNLLVNPARGLVPLPIKPTIRMRDHIAYTPVLIQPLPTQVLGSTSTLPLQPTLTRPGYMAPTASVTLPTTRRPKTSTPRKGKKAKLMPMPKVSKTTDIQFSSSETNQKPQLHNSIGEVKVWVGTYFEVKIPANTFFDEEDGNTEKLQLLLQMNHNQALHKGSWIQFNSSRQVLYGLPDQSHVGRHEFLLIAVDKGNSSAMDAFQVEVNYWPVDEQTPVMFAARFQGEPTMLTNNIHKKILFCKKLAFALGDRNSSSVTLKNISSGSILVEWTNSSLPKNTCPSKQIHEMCLRISDAQGHPTSIFYSAMGPEFRPINIEARGINKCQRFSFLPQGEIIISVLPENISVPVPSTVTPLSSTGWHGNDDVYLHTVIPSVVVAALLLTAGFIAMVCYRKKRNGKFTTEELATFIKKGVPIIFADELDDVKSPPSSSMPLILREEKPPMSLPHYPSSACEVYQISEEYIFTDDDDPCAPPYQAPPPLTVPIDSRGSRLKNMTDYRCPLPYVPP